MQEYVIEKVSAAGEVVGLIHVERDGRITEVKPSFAAYSHLRKFRVKARAEAIAAQVKPVVGITIRIAPTFGGFQYGTKSSVPGLKVAPKGIRG